MITTEEWKQASKNILRSTRSNCKNEFECNQCIHTYSGEDQWPAKGAQRHGGKCRRNWFVYILNPLMHKLGNFRPLLGWRPDAPTAGGAAAWPCAMGGGMGGDSGLRPRDPR